MKNSFHVKGLLGQGTFGNVLEIVNCETKEKLAMKVIRPQHEFHNQGQHELRMLKMIQKYFPDEPTLLQYKTAFYSNSASEVGTLQTHLCLIFPKFEMTLTHLLRGGSVKGFTMTSVSHVAKQLCHALNCLRKVGIHHRDIKPDNIMVRKPPVGDMVEVCLIDFGSATTNVEPSSKPYVQSRFYRAPEVMLGHTYTMDVDMWSFGCVLVELVFAKPIYLGQNEKEQLALINHFQGPFPRSIVEWGTATLCREFSSDYDVHTNEIGYNMISASVKHYWSHDTLKDVCLKEKLCRQEDFSNTQVRQGFYDFIRGCLQIDYTQRWTPEQAMGHPFLKYHENKGILYEFGGYSPPPRRSFTSQRYSALSSLPIAPIYSEPHYHSPSNSYSYSSESDGSSPDRYSMDHYSQYYPAYSPSYKDSRHSPSYKDPRHSPSYNGNQGYSWNNAKPQREYCTRRRMSCQYQNWRNWDHDFSSKMFDVKPRSYSQDFSSRGGYQSYACL